MGKHEFKILLLKFETIQMLIVENNIPDNVLVRGGGTSYLEITKIFMLRKGGDIEKSIIRKDNNSSHVLEWCVTNRSWLDVD